MRTEIILSTLLLTACSDATVVKDYLALVSVSPDQGATQVAVNTDVIAGFSEALDSSTVDQQNVYITDATGGPVVASVEYNSKAHWLVVNPEADLMPNSTYVVTFTSNLKGTRSGNLLSPVQTQFTTAGINPSNGLPSAVAGEDAAAQVGDTITLDGTASTDPEGAALTFQWRVVIGPANSEASLSSTTQPTPTFTIDTEGEYVFGLVVNDGIQDSSEDFISIQALGVAPPEDTDSGSPEDTGSSDTEDSGLSDAPDTGA